MDLQYLFTILYIPNEGKAAARRGAAVAQRFVAADTAAENSIYRRAETGRVDADDGNTLLTLEKERGNERGRDGERRERWGVREERKIVSERVEKDRE